MSRSYATTRYSSSAPATGVWYQDEVPSGTKNGINVTFTLAHGSITELFLESQGQYLVSGIDYTLSGTTITMTTAPLSSDVFVANYLTSSAQVWYQDEIPSGTKNGINTSFTLAHVPTAIVFLYIQGQYQTSGTDYTRTGTAITMTTAPLSTDTFVCNYM